MVFKDYEDYQFQRGFTTQQRFDALPEAEKEKYQNADNYWREYLLPTPVYEWPRLTFDKNADGDLVPKMV